MIWRTLQKVLVIIYIKYLSALPCAISHLYCKSGLMFKIQHRPFFLARAHSGASRLMAIV